MPLQTGIPSSSLVSGRVVNLVPDVEVPQKAKRRKFTVEYKRFIVREADACRESKQISAMLRREGLYHSTLVTWRNQAEQGELEGLSSKKEVLWQRGSTRWPVVSLSRKKKI
jgi:transposase-like protein